MLEEFVTDLMKLHAEQLKVLREKLEATDGGDRHDLTRGGIRALVEFDRKITDLLQEYRKPVAVTKDFASDDLIVKSRAGYGRVPMPIAAGRLG